MKIIQPVEPMPKPAPYNVHFDYDVDEVRGELRDILWARFVCANQCCVGEALAWCNRIVRSPHQQRHQVAA